MKKLGPIEIELTDSVGTLYVDPNRAAAIGALGALPLVGAVGSSDVSSKPGFRYRSNRLDVILTTDEMLRFMRKDLLPHEVKSLREKVGVVSEISDFYYDPRTLEALIPTPLITPGETLDVAPGSILVSVRPRG